MEEFTNQDRGERARAAFLASEHVARNNEPLTNLADLVCDLLHLADHLAQPEDDPLGDAALKRRYDGDAGRDLTLGEFTAARALDSYLEELAGM